MKKDKKEFKQKFELKKVICPKCKEIYCLKLIAFVWDEDLNEVRIAINCLNCLHEGIIIVRSESKGEIGSYVG